jgi:hypothetical protein
VSKKPYREPEDPEQSKRFIEAARDVGADETTAGADRAFKKIMLSKSKAHNQN